MAKAKTNDPCPWFRFHTGSFGADTRALSFTEQGIYIQLMSMYWAKGCKLPFEDAMLGPRIGCRSPEETEGLTFVLNLFFPVDAGGSRRHAELDEQLQGVKANSELQRQRRLGGSTKAAATGGSTEDDSPNF